MSKINNSDYFRFLSSVLLEAEDIDQSEIEEKDIDEKNQNIDTNQNKEKIDEPDQDEEVYHTDDPEMAGLDDASYMEAPEEPVVDDTILRQQKVKLFDNLSDLRASIRMTSDGLRKKLSLYRVINS